MSGRPSFWRDRRRPPQRLPWSQQHEPPNGVKPANLALSRPYDLSTLHCVGVRGAEDGPRQCQGLC